MFKLIAFREDTWFVPAAEYQMYNHLANAYGGEAQMIREWDEAIVPEEFVRVALDETGSIELSEFIHPENAVYFFGKTHQASSDFLRLTKPHVTLRIDLPNKVELWGVQVAAMILRHRYERDK